MKFIGQYIQSFIARFRNDVYLEDIDTGTIASGGNLGLDSNNKIVKATEATGDITGVDLTGTAPIAISSETGTTSGDYSATIGIASASTTAIGAVELATTAETTTGTDTTRAVTPDGLKDGYQGSANVTTLGTISTGEWRGTAINATYLSGQSGTNTGDETLASINALDITEVGTIDSGVWNGTAIATAYIADDAVTFAKASGVSPNVYGSVIKLIPSDFVSNDDGGNQKFGIGYVDDGGASTYGMRGANSATELYAFVSIPEGMKAVSVHIYDLNDLAIEVYEVQVNANTMTSKGTGNCGTTLTLSSAVESSATNFLAIEITTTDFTNDRVYGGIVTIAAI